MEQVYNQGEPGKNRGSRLSNSCLRRRFGRSVNADIVTKHGLRSLPSPALPFTKSQRLFGRIEQAHLLADVALLRNMQMHRKLASWTPFGLHMHGL